MSLKILGPRPYFWQWDSGQKLVVGNCNCDEVHFCNGTKDSALVVKIETTDDGTRTVDVPNILLQVAEPIKAYLFHRNASGNMTRTRYIFQVIERTKPEDYIYTEEEILTWQQLSDRIDELEENPAGDYVKTVNNVSPDEKGNVAIDVKETLVVSVYPNLQRVDARVFEILQAVNNNQSVILEFPNGEFCCLDGIIDNKAVFSKTYIYEGNIVQEKVVVNANGTCKVSQEIVESSGGDAVLYTEQNLTEEQKAQARENIGIDGNGKSAYQYACDGGYTGTEEEFAEKLASEGGSPDAVLYTPQNLAEEQKAQVRENIGVVSTDEIINEVLAAIPVAEGVKF